MEQQSSSSSYFQAILEQLQQITFNLRLAESLEFETNYLLLPLQGEFEYQNFSPNISSSKFANVYRLPQTTRMFRQITTAHSWNTLFAHMFLQKMISFEEKFNMDLLPLVVQFSLESVCWCQLKSSLNLSEPPVTHINSSGIQINAKFQLTVKASGFPV